MRRAVVDDVPTIMEILDAARQFQREHGSLQWPDDYPSPEIIKEDIMQDAGRVFTLGTSMIGYISLSPREEYYDTMESVWEDRTSYLVLHRFALSPMYRGQGLSPNALAMVKKEAEERNVGELRLDTGLENSSMHRLMGKEEWECLGKHPLPWGEAVIYRLKLK